MCDRAGAILVCVHDLCLVVLLCCVLSLHSAVVGLSSCCSVDRSLIDHPAIKKKHEPMAHAFGRCLRRYCHFDFPLLDIKRCSMNPFVACFGLVTSAFPCQMRKIRRFELSPPRLFLARRSWRPQVAVAEILGRLWLSSACTKCLGRSCIKRRSPGNGISRAPGRCVYTRVSGGKFR